jgi:hypothetical protein
LRDLLRREFIHFNNRVVNINNILPLLGGQTLHHSRMDGKNGIIIAAIRKEIAALCREGTRVQTEQHKYRHCRRDERHDAWDKELQTIQEKRQELIQQQKMILRQLSQKRVVLAPQPESVHE